jgi:hypothetical protein
VAAVPETNRYLGTQYRPANNNNNNNNNTLATSGKLWITEIREVGMGYRV